ncbi:hypothetical protein V6N13_053171 [Hibiscus sabdariffa]
MGRRGGDFVQAYCCCFAVAGFFPICRGQHWPATIKRKKEREREGGFCLVGSGVAMDLEGILYAPMAMGMLFVVIGGVIIQGGR